MSLIRWKLISMGCAVCNNRTLTTGTEPPAGARRNVRMHSEVRIQPQNFINFRTGTMRKDYSIGKKLGEGGYGFVRLATHISSQSKRAIKSIRKDAITKDLKEKAKFYGEIDILKSSDHPNIVRLHEFYKDSCYYHLVFEYIAGGELLDYITSSETLTEPTAAFFMKQILSGVAYCHSRNIVHRDLKPQNLLLEKPTSNSILKIIDFGNSKNFDENIMTQAYGTIHYVAPEVLKKSYNEKCDIWSCGVILYLLLSGALPFSGRTENQIIRNILAGQYSLVGSPWDDLSEDATHLVAQMLMYDPAQRISAAAALQHPWIASCSNRARTSEKVITSALGNLRQFRAEVKFQHAVLTYITSQLVKRDQSKRLTETFREMDRNNDARLSRDELVQAYQKLLDPEEALIEVERIIAQVDVDNSGFIDYTEFLMATIESDALISKNNLEAAFREFDRDNNGKITPDEVKEIFGTGQNVPESIWKELVQEADLNGDGQIDLCEFKDLMTAMFEVKIPPKKSKK